MKTVYRVYYRLHASGPLETWMFQSPWRDMVMKEARILRRSGYITRIVRTKVKG